MWQLTFKEVMAHAQKRHGKRLSKNEVKAYRTTYQSMEPWKKSVALCYLTGIDVLASPETAIGMFRGIFHQNPTNNKVWYWRSSGKVNIATHDIVQFLEHVSCHGFSDENYGRAVRIAGHGLFHSPAGILVFELPDALKSSSSTSSSQGGDV
jgi:hypothetical protein